MDFHKGNPTISSGKLRFSYRKVKGERGYGEPARDIEGGNGGNGGTYEEGEGGEGGSGNNGGLVGGGNEIFLR